MFENGGARSVMVKSCRKWTHQPQFNVSTMLHIPMWFPLSFHNVK